MIQSSRSILKEVVDFDNLDVQRFKNEPEMEPYRQLWNVNLFQMNEGVPCIQHADGYLGVPALQIMVKKIADLARTAAREDGFSCAVELREGLWRSPEMTALCQRVVKRELQIDRTGLLTIAQILNKIFDRAEFGCSISSTSELVVMKFTWPHNEVFCPKQKIKNMDHEALFCSFDSFRKNREFTDCTMVVEGQEVPCHRMVLAANSPIFRRNMSERLTLANVTRRTVEHVLDFCYTGEAIITHPVSDDYLNLLAFAHKYEMGKLKEACGQATPTNLASISRVFKAAVLFDCYHLKERCTEFLARHDLRQIIDRQHQNFDEDELAMYAQAVNQSNALQENTTDRDRLLQLLNDEFMRKLATQAGAASKV